MSSQQPETADTVVPAAEDHRLLQIVALCLGALVFLALPFALSAGAEFFVPVIAAILISLALAPLTDWLESRKVPNWLASLLSIIGLFGVVSLAIAVVIQPAIGMIEDLPQMASKIANRVSLMSGWLDRVTMMAERVTNSVGKSDTPQVVIASTSAVEDFIIHTPGVLLRILVTVLLAYFMLKSRFALRRQMLLGRQEFSASLRAARMLDDVHSMTGAYFATTFFVACGVGVVAGLGAWAFGWRSPVMWGGLAGLLNLLPYVGPLTMVALLAFFGLAGEGSIAWSLTPAAAYLAMHTVESNVVTPILLGRRLSISPVAILVALTYFGWIWGIAGIIMAGPLLVVLSAFANHSGKLNIFGFLLGEPLFAPPEPADAAVQAG